MAQLNGPLAKELAAKIIRVVETVRHLRQENEHHLSIEESLRDKIAELEAQERQTAEGNRKIETHASELEKQLEEYQKLNLQSRVDSLNEQIAHLKELLSSYETDQESVDSTLRAAIVQINTLFEDSTLTAASSESETLSAEPSEPVSEQTDDDETDSTLTAASSESETLSAEPSEPVSEQTDDDETDSTLTAASSESETLSAEPSEPVSEQTDDDETDSTLVSDEQETPSEEPIEDIEEEALEDLQTETSEPAHVSLEDDSQSSDEIFETPNEPEGSSSEEFMDLSGEIFSTDHSSVDVPLTEESTSEPEGEEEISENDNAENVSTESESEKSADPVSLLF